MSDLLHLGNVKQGTDKRFRPVRVTVRGEEVDLSDGYTVTARLRTRADGAAVDFAIDKNGPIVVLSLTSAASGSMALGTWYGDILVVTPEGKRLPSATFTITVTSLYSKEDEDP